MLDHFIANNSARIMMPFQIMCRYYCRAYKTNMYLHFDFWCRNRSRCNIGIYQKSREKESICINAQQKSNLLKTHFAFLLLLYTLCAFRPAILWKPHFIFTTSYDYFKLLPRLRLAFLHVFYVWVLKERKTNFSLLELKSEINIILILKAWYAHCIIRLE